MGLIEDIRALGYTVEIAQDYTENEDVECSYSYWIVGFGASVMVLDTDTETLESFADPALHALRLAAPENPSEGATSEEAADALPSEGE